MVDTETLVLRDLKAGYGPVSALRGVTVEVPAGSVVAVLGANGAGKSTLLRAISGTLRFHRGGITAGEICLGTRRISALNAADVVAAGVVHVPEGRQVFGRMTVAENLRAGAIGAPRSRRGQARAWVDELFPVLTERAGQRAGLLSGGEQQMLAIGRALMAEPKILLLDEPTLGLAPQMAERIAATIRRINAEGTSVLLVEQNAAMALRLADTAFLLEVGEVTLSGPAAELAATDEVQKRYLGIGTEPEIDPKLVPTLRRWTP
ncbi:MAG: ABC transporter ATP-binding protein [Streptosporangiaceae bacterium]